MYFLVCVGLLAVGYCIPWCSLYQRAIAVELVPAASSLRQPSTIWTFTTSGISFVIIVFLQKISTKIITMLEPRPIFRG